MRARWFIGLVVILMALAACQPATNTTPPPPTFTPVGSASLGDLTWHDANANGIQDAGEEGLADVLVRLYDVSGKMLAETRSDAEGRYVFSGLQGGDYTLEFAAPSGYVLTQPDKGGDDARDSDPDPASGKTALISLNAGQSAMDWDAGFVAEVAALPTETPTPEPTLTPTSAGPPVEPEEVVFHGKAAEIHGRYYRAATEDAPLVVLLHWVRGDMTDWNEVAVWLQNRGQKNPYPNPGSDPYWDPSWFPPVPAGRSYNVLLITYSGCQPAPVGCPAKPPDGWFFPTMSETWLFDSLMLPSQISDLTGVPSSRIVFIGASIGADGAVIACAELGCAGALSLSPGNFLADPWAPDTSYSGAVKRLVGERNPPAHVWCLADENEIGVCKKAESVGGANYRAIEIPGGGHGMELLQPNLDPLPMQEILEFLKTVFGK